MVAEGCDRRYSLFTRDILLQYFGNSQRTNFDYYGIKKKKTILSKVSFYYNQKRF